MGKSAVPFFSRRTASGRGGPPGLAAVRRRFGLFQVWEFFMKREAALSRFQYVLSKTHANFSQTRFAGPGFSACRGPRAS